MLLTSQKLNTNFVYHFKRKFNNFCKKAPILLSFEILPNFVVVIKNSSANKTFEYTLNFTKDIKENINQIKKYLQNNWYPILEEEINSEIKDLSKITKDTNIEVEDVDKLLFNSKIVKYRIDKVIFGVYSEFHELKGQNRNEVIITDNKEQSYLYRLKMPVLLFLDKIRSMNRKDAYNFMVNNSYSCRKIGKEQE